MISLRVLKNRLVIILTASVVIPLVACTHEADISGFPEVCFTGEVLPVFQNNCTMSGCHTGGGDEEMPLTTYEEIMNGIVPGSPEASEIYRSITSKWGQRMPPGQPLGIGNRTLIRLWIEQGAGQTSCSAGPPADTGGNYVSRACFSRDILPVIVSHCASPGCHDAATHKEGYILTSYSSIRGMVRPGDPSNSRLYRVITVSGEDRMPPSGSPGLSSAQIDSIRQWITYGALDESCGEVCDTINPVSFSGALWPLIQQSCTGCHSGSAPAGNILLNSYQNIASVASNGLLMNSLTGTGVTRMPPSGPLSQCRIEQFRKWIVNGYPNN